MGKRYFRVIFAVIFCLWLTVQGLAFNPAFMQAVVDGAECSNCTGSYMFCYDGEHATDNDTANGASGDLAGTVSGVTIHGDYAYCGNYGVLTDANDEDLFWATTDNTDVNATQGTLSVRVRTPGSYSGSTYLFQIYVDSDNQIYGGTNSNGEVGLVHEGNTSNVTLTTVGTVPTSQWNLIKFSWSTSPNEVAVKINSGSWETEGSGTVTDFATDEMRLGGNIMSDDIWIDNVSLTSGYQD